jgi:hypothetical protein
MDGIDRTSEDYQKSNDSILNGSETIYREIRAALDEGRGALIGRHGTIELSVSLALYWQKNLSSAMKQTLELNAGVFPKTTESIKEWYKEYKHAVEEASILVTGWYGMLAKEEHIYTKIICSSSVKYIPLRSLEPYYCIKDTVWTRVLEGQRVTVVSSFTNSMKKQIEYSELIWPHCNSILPKTTEWSFVRSFYGPETAKGACQWPEHIQSWKDAVDSLEKDVLETNPRIVLIGCGGLAMPLAWRLKQKGCIVVVLGGAIQLMFGIKGRRWDKHPVISKFYTADWIYPSIEEIPGAALEIEGGCYW